MKEQSTGTNYFSSKSDWWFALFVATMGFLLYANTIGNDYAIDDGAVITTNPYVQKGVKGLPGIFTTDTWHFENADLGYYRPLSLATFAIENQFFHNTPHVSHLINILLYAVTGLVLYFLLLRIFGGYNRRFSLVVALLFIAHPVHTEVIANIKNRDEILSFLNLLLAIYFLLRSTGGNWKWPLVSCLFYYLALLSKETAMTGVLLIPVILYFTTSLKFAQILKRVSPFILLLLLFQGQKYLALGHISPPHADDIVSFPYAGANLKLAAAFTNLCWYVKLILIPFPLSYNYAYNQIPVSSWTSPPTIIGMLMSVTLLFAGFSKINKKALLQLGTLIFAILLLPAMGFVLLMGGILAERFLYSPALGFCIVVAWLIFKWTKVPLSSHANLASGPPVKFLPVALILTGYSFITVSRNSDWKDDLSISRHDVLVTPNSCQVHLHYGKKLIDLGVADTDPGEKRVYFVNGVEQLRLALNINPHYARAYFKLAYAYQALEENTDSAIYFYNRAIDEAPGYALAYSNLGALYAQLGRVQLATRYLEKALQISHGLVDANLVLQRLQKPQGTVSEITDTTSFEFYTTGGINCVREKNFDKAQEYLLKAVALKPTSVEALVNLAACYGMMQDFAKSEETLIKAQQLQPYNKSVLQNLATLYHVTGNKEKEKEYRDKLKE